MNVDQFIHDQLQSSAEANSQLGKRFHHEIAEAGSRIARALSQNGSIWICGTAAYTGYISAEMASVLCRDRGSLAVVSLAPSGSSIVAIQQAGRAGDLLIAMCTDAEVPGILLEAVAAARSAGISTFVLTGDRRGRLLAETDLTIAAPSTDADQMEQAHTAMLRLVCRLARKLLPPPHRENQLPAKPSAGAKIRSIAELSMMRKDWRVNGQTVVWTNGVFDLLHNGHVRNLQSAKALGAILVVGVNSDRSVKSIKGPSRPIQDETSRAEMLAALECVDYVAIFDESTPIVSLEALQPDIHCKGADYANNAKPIPERETVERYGGRIHFLEMLPGFSTTALIERIRSEKVSP